jgi:hypothetical protein
MGQHSAGTCLGGRWVGAWKALGQHRRGASWEEDTANRLALEALGLPLERRWDHSARQALGLALSGEALGLALRR